MSVRLSPVNSPEPTLHPLGGEVEAHWFQEKMLDARATGEPRNNTTDTTTTAEMLFMGTDLRWIVSRCRALCSERAPIAIFAADRNTPISCSAIHPRCLARPANDLGF